MKWLSPSWTGFLSGIGLMLALGACLMVIFSIGLGIDSVPAGVLARLSQAGVGLLIAYSVAVSAIERGASPRHIHEGWLGFTTGVGASGLAGAALCLGWADSWNATNAGLGAMLCLWWAAVSVAVLGVIVAALPLLYDEWRGSPEPLE